MALGLALSWAASLLGASSAHAGKISFPDACWKAVDQNHYLIRGDRTSEDPGARLWNLDKLTQDWSLGRGGENDCTQKIYQQAVADGDEYWKRIGQNYHCTDAAVSPKPEVCTRKNGYNDNQSYLAVVKTVLELPQGNGCGEHRGVASKAPDEAPVKAVRDAAPVIQKALNAQTADPKEKAEAKPAKAAQPAAEASTCNADNAKRSTEEALATFGAGCGAGIIKQFVQEVWDFVSGVGHAIAHPIDTVSSLAEFASELVRHPDVIARQIVESYAEMWPEAACLTSYEKSQAVCKIGTKLLFDIGLTVTGGKTIKFTADVVKFMAKKAVKASGVALATTGKVVGTAGKVVGFVTPKFIKNPIKKAATSAADAVTNKTAATAAKVTNAAKSTVAGGAMYLQTNAAGQVVLKVYDTATKAKAKAALIVGTRAGKLFLKPTIYFAKMPLYFYAGNQKEVDGFKKNREKDAAEAEKAKAHQKKVEQFNAKGDKFVEDVAKKFDGVSTCEEAAKAYNGIVAQYKLTKDEYATKTLEGTYAAVQEALASQLGVVCKK